MELDFTDDALAQFNALREPVRSRVQKAIQKLQNWPTVSGVKPLTENLAGHWRMRVADKYRVLFRVEGDVLTILSVGHRDGFYDGR